MRKTALSLTAIALTACAPTERPADEIPPPPSGPAKCDAEPAQGLLGRKADRPLGEDVMRLTGATILRWGPPGAMFTRDYRIERVNVMYDEAMIVTDINCG